jgi:PEP-CTERM motif
MHSRRMPLGFALVISAVLVLGSPAKADSITFSFANTLGGVSGTVTGIILGLTNNATGPASDVIITSTPAVFSNLPPLPIDANVDGFDTLVNSFTESAGVITFADYSVLEQVPGTNSTGRLNLQLNEVDGLLQDYDLNGSVDGPITFAATGQVPEPSGLLLMALGLAAALGVRRNACSRR